MSSPGPPQLPSQEPSPAPDPFPNRPCPTARPLSSPRIPPSESALRIFSWNANRFGAEKFAHMLQLCADLALDVVGIQEANLLRNGNRAIPGFASLSKSPRLIVYVRDNRHFRLLPQFCQFTDDVDVLTVLVDSIAMMFVYLRRGCVYSPCETALQLFSSCMLHFPDAALLGDLNARSVTMGHELPNCAGLRLDSYLDSHRVEILNNPMLPTFFRAGCRPSILDICIVSQRLLNKVQHFETLDMQISDHRPLLLGLKARPDSRYPDSVSDLEALFELRSFNLHLRTMPASFTATCTQAFNQLASQDFKISTEERWMRIRQAISESAHHLGLCRRRQSTRFRKPWMTQDLLALSREARYDASLRQEFRQQVLKAKQEHWSRFVASIDAETCPSVVWRKFRASRGAPNSPHSVADPYDTVQDIRADFLSFCTPEIPPNPEADSFLCSLLANDFDVALASPPPEFSMEELCHAISRGSKKSAPGPDGISYGILKLLPDSILTELLVVLQEIYVTGTIPSTLQDALQVALPKSQPGTFRPITLSATSIKTLERMVLRRIKTQLEPTLPDWQFGFRDGCGAADQLLRFTSYLKSQRKAKKSTVLLFLDIKKAFDRVDYALLLKKLHSLGIDAYTLRFIHSLLTQRRIFVTHKNAVSEPYTPTGGVPQGGILSPILWNIYFSDVLCRVTDPDVRAFGYADDLALAVSCKSPIQAHRRMSKVYQAVRDWTDSNRIQLSDSKVKSMLILPRVHKRTREKRSNLRVKYQDPTHKTQDVERTRCYKYLGALFDDKLDFSHWTQAIAQETRRRTQLVRRLASSMQLSRTHIERFYVGYIRGFLLYGAALWSQASKTYRDRILSADRAGTRMCVGALPRTPTAAVEQESTLVPLTEVLESLLLRSTARYLHKPQLSLVKDEIMAALEIGEVSTTSILNSYRSRGLHAAADWDAALDLLRAISPHKKKQDQWKYHKLLPWKERTLARFRMGVIPTQAWANELSLSASSLCRHCGLFTETADHLILPACPRLDYSLLRTVWRRMSISTPGLPDSPSFQDLQTLLKDPTNIYHSDLEESLLKFITDNHLFTRRRQGPRQ